MIYYEFKIHDSTVLVAVEHIESIRGDDISTIITTTSGQQFNFKEPYKKYREKLFALLEIGEGKHKGNTEWN